jgi:hypothetical protein
MADLAFTVDPACLTADNYAHVLYGWRNPEIQAMEVNNQVNRIWFPTSNSWQLEIILAPGTNTLSIKAQDAAGLWTAAVDVELSLPAFQQESHHSWNVVDEHGLEMQLERNPGEKNWDYKNRLKSFAFHPTGATIERLFFAAAHELGIQPDPAALGLRVNRDARGDIMSESVNLEVTPVAVYVDCDELVQTREAHRVEPRFRRVTMDQYPRWVEQVEVWNENEDRVRRERYTVDWDKKQITFEDDDLSGSWIILQYPYRYRIEHKAMTMAQLKTALEAIQIGGTSLLEVTHSDAALLAGGLIHRGRLGVTRDWSYIPHARVQVTGLENYEFQQSMLNQFGAGYDTKLELYARRAAEKSTIGWDNLILDEGLWDVGLKDGSYDYLPRLFDAVFGRWTCDTPTCTTWYTLYGYKRCNGVCPVCGYALKYYGIPEGYIKSGICEPGSLLVKSGEFEEEL